MHAAHIYASMCVHIFVCASCPFCNNPFPSECNSDCMLSECKDFCEHAICATLTVCRQVCDGDISLGILQKFVMEEKQMLKLCQAAMPITVSGQLSFKDFKDALTLKKEELKFFEDRRVSLLRLCEEIPLDQQGQGLSIIHIIHNIICITSSSAHFARFCYSGCGLRSLRSLLSHGHGVDFV